MTVLSHYSIKDCDINRSNTDINKNNSNYDNNDTSVFP